MALDQFKTQVLLLHSEQRMLDSLSLGLGDRYTVHCATSGSEALNTLGQTPINVIISAQDLPGMSGVEALREARKRSPETVGILLAGATATDLEAMVGADEVFEIVRGSVTGEQLTTLVERATQQIRLMAISESANDTTASAVEDSEHIVMETSENGSTIITGSGGPTQSSGRNKAANATIDILVLTKDRDFLATVKEATRGTHNVHFATSLKQADDTIREYKAGVAIVDAALVGKKIEQLTQHLRQGSPRLVSIVAGRREDGEMLMDLINRGKVYRFLLKPVSPGRARLAIEASAKHHLEAPDAAFANKDKDAGKTNAAPARRPAARTAPGHPQPGASASQRDVGSTTSTAAMPGLEPNDPPLGALDGSSPINDGLSAAFAADKTSFKDTVSDLLSTVGGAFKGKKDEVPRALEHDGPVIGESLAALPDESGGPEARKLLILGLAVAGVAVVAGGLYWVTVGIQGDPAAVSAVPGAATVADEGTRPEPVAETEAEAEAVSAVISEPVAGPAVEAVDEPAVDVEALIAAARRARDAGQIYSPAGSNAIELFAAAVAADPANDLAAVELDAAIENALATAEAALLQSRSEVAAAALRRVALADPNNARLPFLTAQLSRVQLRTYLAGARIAIRDARFEDAANLLAAARNLDIADRSEIETVVAELNAARSDQRVDEVLVLANTRLEEGALLQPPNDNARYLFELVLANDPSNPVARQGLNGVASRVVLQARRAIDAGNLDRAADLLASARAIDGGNGDLSATQAALVAARQAIAASERRRAAATTITPTASAQQPAGTVQAAADREPAARPAAATTTDASPETSAPSGSGAGTVDVSAQEPVSISSLARTRYVAPKYPRTAERRGDSGWVDVLFTVTFDGTVKDVAVRESSPEGTFDRAAVRAVERWTFEPIVENGELVEKRAGVRMMFAIEN